MSTQTFSLEDAAAQMGQRPEWVAARLRSGVFAGYKIGRKWRMSAEDIACALTACRREATASPIAAGQRPLSLTRTSRRRTA